MKAKHKVKRSRKTQALIEHVRRARNALLEANKYVMGPEVRPLMKLALSNIHGAIPLARKLTT